MCLAAACPSPVLCAADLPWTKPWAARGCPEHTMWWAASPWELSAGTDLAPGALTCAGGNNTSALEERDWKKFKPGKYCLCLCRVALVCLPHCHSTSHVFQGSLSSCHEIYLLSVQLFVLFCLGFCFNLINFLNLINFSRASLESKHLAVVLVGSEQLCFEQEQEICRSQP